MLFCIIVRLDKKTIKRSKKHHKNKELDTLVEETISSAIARYKKEILANTVNETKPDFELDDIKGGKVRLADLLDGL